MKRSIDRADGLAGDGIPAVRAWWNLSVAQLCEESLRRHEGILSADGALVCATGAHTGRSPGDKFIVREAASEAHVCWGAVNQPMDEAQYGRLEADMAAYLRGREVYVQDLAGGADPAYRVPVRVITERAWQSLFARNLLLSRKPDAATGFTMISAPDSRRRPRGTALTLRP